MSFPGAVPLNHQQQHQKIDICDEKCLKQTCAATGAVGTPAAAGIIVGCAKSTILGVITGGAVAVVEAVGTAVYCCVTKKCCQKKDTSTSAMSIELQDRDTNALITNQPSTSR